MLAVIFFNAIISRSQLNYLVISRKWALLSWDKEIKQMVVSSYYLMFICLFTVCLQSTGVNMSFWNWPFFIMSTFTSGTLSKFWCLCFCTFTISKILKAGLLLVTEYFYSAVLLLVQDLNTSSTTAWQWSWRLKSGAIKWTRHSFSSSP